MTNRGGLIIKPPRYQFLFQTGLSTVNVVLNQFHQTFGIK